MSIQCIIFFFLTFILHASDAITTELYLNYAKQYITIQLCNKNEKHEMSSNRLIGLYY